MTCFDAITTLGKQVRVSRVDKKCGKSGIPDNRKCTKQTATPETEAKARGVSTATLLTGAGVAVSGVVLGTLAYDVFSSGVPKEKVPPKTPPDGLYDTFKPGDLIYQTNDFAGAARAHYAVYVGKLNGKHTVFDTSLDMKGGKTKNSIRSAMKMRSIDEAQDTGTSFALASREDGGSRARPTQEQLLKIISKLNNRSFDWTGFESNCETFARAVVNDIPVSTQTKNVSAMTKQLSKALVSALAPDGYRQRAVKQANIQGLVNRTLNDSACLLVQTDSGLDRTVVTARLDKKCGASGIPDNATCHKGGSWPQAATIGAALTAGGIAAFALSRGSSNSAPPSAAPPSASPSAAGPSPTPRLPGSSPRALLKPAPPRQSKTQRMRANTAAAVRNAEGRIAQTAREEVRRIAQIGNTMAAAGEATGMAAKTTLRELRLRTEAARRRFEPGYRAPDQRRLPEGTQPKLTASSFTPQREAIPLDPRTGQPRRRKAQGFGRTDNYIQHYAPVQLQPPTRRDACWEGYEQIGMKRQGKRKVPNCVPTAQKQAQADTEAGKKYTKVVTNPETGRKNKVRYGAKGYTIAPGTAKGDRYCARSFGDMKSEGYDCSGAERNTPLCLSRAKWKCSGKTSRR